MGDVWFSCCDVTYYKEKFYIVDADESITVCDVNRLSSSVSVTRMHFLPPMGHLVSLIVNLVDSGDELLAVVCQLTLVLTHHRHSIFYFNSVFFRVYKMNWSGPRSNKVEDLGDRSLFVMENSIVSLSTINDQGCLQSFRYMSRN